MTYDTIIPAIVRAARRAPTPAGLASLAAALSGRPTPAAQNDERRAALPDGLDDFDALPVAAPVAPSPDPHDLGQPDSRFDWMFAARPGRDSVTARGQTQD